MDKIMKGAGWIIACIVVLGCIAMIQRNFPYTFGPIQSVLYDSQGDIIVAKKVVGYTTYEEIPESLRDMIVNHEDKRFWSHGGVDGKGILRAIWDGRRNGGIRQGASTIDQQVIKLDQEAYVRTRKQKIHEIRRATTIQHHLSKEEILLRYTNAMPFMHGVVGWKAACEYYRRQSCQTLDQTKRYLLFASSKTGRSLYNHAYTKRLVDETWSLGGGVIDKDHILRVLRSLPEKPIQQGLDPRVVDYLEQGEQTGWYNTQLSDAIDSALDAVGSQRKKYAIQDCCVVVLDKDGHVLSMNFCTEWGSSYGSMTNMCLQPRQTGSVTKPFLYTYAMHELGYTPETTIEDEYVEYALGGGGVYTPQNFDLTYHGKVTLAYALGNSLNIPAVKLVDAVGVSHYFDFLKETLYTYAGEEPVNQKQADDVGLSIALGTFEMTPLGLTHLWRFFLDRNHAYSKQGDAVVRVLKDPRHKVASFGQDSLLNSLGWGVKTGTSRKFIDGWVCGVHTAGEISACIRLGNSTNQPMHGSSSEVGSFVWHLVTQAIEKWSISSS